VQHIFISDKRQLQPVSCEREADVNGGVKVGHWAE
jgi:hypothetical protein